MAKATELFCNNADVAKYPPREVKDGVVQA